MRLNTLNKFEINVFNPIINLGPVSDFAFKHGAAAIVAPPAHIQPLLLQRGMLRGQYKIICALDFDGKYFALDKVSKLRDNPIGADGFEIMLSNGRSEIEARNELQILYNFLRSNNQLIEVRWCLGVLNKQPTEVEAVLKHIGKYPPSAIRLDRQALKVDDYEALLPIVRKFVTQPVKLDGTDPEVVKAFEQNQNVSKFDITFDAARALIVSMSKPPQTETKQPEVPTTGPNT